MAPRLLLCALIATGCGRIAFDAQRDADDAGDASSESGVPAATQLISVGNQFSCAVHGAGNTLTCWGRNSNGELGVDSMQTWGNDGGFLPRAEPDVALPQKVIQIDSGANHTCAVLEGLSVYCWGEGTDGKLGHGNLTNIGDSPAHALTAPGPVNLGAPALEVATGGAHTCVLIVGGTVRCWGLGANGRLGNASAVTINDAATSTPVSLGGNAVEIDARGAHTCARLEDGSVRCWGGNANGYLGLGTSGMGDVGDDEVPSSVPAIDLGGRAVELAAGADSTCARLESGDVHCWGNGANGRLGYGNTNPVGDQGPVKAAGRVDLPGPAIRITAGGEHTCALLADNTVRCWGNGSLGQLGYGNTNNIGDSSTLAGVPAVPLGPERVVDISAGGNHTCARYASDAVACWGEGGDGALGYGNTSNVGDVPARIPSIIGPVPLD